MTTITGTLLHPVTGELATGYARFRLVNERGERITDATVDGGAVVGESIATLTAGAYSVVLPANIDIQSDQQATYWQRLHGPSVRRLLVPASGTWDELDITVDPPMSSPDPIATNLITSAFIEASVTGLSVQPFFFTAVPGTAVTVPDLTYSVELRGRAPVICPGTSGITFGLAIRKTSDTTQVDIDYRPAPTAGHPVTSRPAGELDPHSSGEYQLYLTATSSVTMTVDASAAQKAGIGVYAI